MQLDLSFLDTTLHHMPFIRWFPSQTYIHFFSDAVNRGRIEAKLCSLHPLVKSARGLLSPKALHFREMYISNGVL